MRRTTRHQITTNLLLPDTVCAGGVPWDISEQILVAAFSEFGEVRVEWPGRDYSSPPKGYLYLVFQVSWYTPIS